MNFEDNMEENLVDNLVDNPEDMPEVEVKDENQFRTPIKMDSRQL